jgi:predicted translin family RNA/ssDNA-binding protein
MDLFVSFRTNSTTAEDFYEVIYKQLLELKQSFAEQFEIQNASVSKLQKQVEAKLQKKERLLQTVPIFDTFNAVNAKVYEYYNGIGDLSQVVEVQPSTTVIMATTTSEQSQKDAV